MNHPTTILGPNGQPATRAAIPNLDPNFFIPLGGGGSLTAAEIEDQPYKYHPWIAAASRVIAYNVARLPHRLRLAKESDQTETEHEALEILRKPNDLMTEMTLWKAIILALLLPSKSKASNKIRGGQCFLIAADKRGQPVDLRKGQIPAFFFPYTDEFVSAKRGKRGEVEEWIYDPGVKGKKIPYKPENLIRINLFNPYDWTLGIPWYAGAQIAVAQDIQSDIFNTMFFANDARVAGVLTSDQPLSDDQSKMMMKRWYEQYAGPGNAWRVAVLGMGLKYQQYGALHADMQFQETKDRVRKQIIAAFGLNEIALGNYEKLNYATIREGRRMLWQDTYQPIDHLIWDSLNSQWIQYIDGGKWVGESDFSGIEALRPDYKDRATTAGVMVEKLSYPPVLASQLVGIPLTDEHVKEYPWLAEKPEKGGAPFGEGAPPQPPPEKAIRGAKAKVRIADDERVALSWDYIHKILEPGEKRFMSKLERYFNSERNRMQDKVDAWLEQQNGKRSSGKLGAGNAIYRAVHASPEMFLLDIIEEHKSLTKLWKPLVTDQMRAEQIRLEQELGTLIDWGVTDARVDTFIAMRKEQIKGINTTTFKVAREKIGDAIEEAMKDNATPQQAAKRIKEALGDMGEIRKHQARTIARTETGTISSSTRFDAFRTEGIVYQEWVTAGDERVRTTPGADHVMAGRAGPVKIGEVFPGTTNLRFPLDPRGAPGNVINCRCVAVASEGP